MSETAPITEAFRRTLVEQLILPEPAAGSPLSGGAQKKSNGSQKARRGGTLVYHA
jgi:hypothetical protein